MQGRDVDNTSHLYEAQASCVVTGLSNSTWTACYFVDTYFDDTNDMEDWCEDIYLDPLLCNKYDANLPIWNPREYFLLCLQQRLHSIKEEWLRVIYNLRREIEDYVRERNS